MTVSPSGAYVQGILVVNNQGPSAQVLNGFNEAWVANPSSTLFGAGDCRAGTFPPYSQRWCYTGTRWFSHGASVWARGDVYFAQHAARAVPLSPTVKI